MIGHNDFRLKALTSEMLAAALIGLALLGPAAAGDPSTAAPGPAVGDLPPSSLNDPGNFRNLLPLLLTSPDRKQLAADLEALIRQGNLAAAENSLNTAIEVGTLAIVLADHLKDPELLKALQELGIRGEARPKPEAAALSPAVASDACPAPVMATMANLADMQQALEREQSFGAMISQTLTSLMQEHNALAARLETETASQAAKASEIQQALRQEQEKRAAAQQELERLREEHRTLQAAREQDKASGPPSAALEALLRQEREQSANAARQLAGVQKELRDLQAFKAEAMAAESNRVAQLEKALARAQMRGDVLTQALADVDDELRTLREPRQPGVAPVMFRLAAKGLEPPLAPSPASAPVQDAAALPAAAAPASAPAPTPGSVPVRAETTSALPKREPNAVMVASLPEGIQPLPLGGNLGQAAIQPPAGVEPKAAVPAEAPKTDDRLTARAEELLRKGDVSAARLLLEHARGSGHARATFLLAETFDPNMLAKLGVLGIRGDAARARELYAQARALGIAQAGERMEALK